MDRTWLKTYGAVAVYLLGAWVCFALYDSNEGSVLAGIGFVLVASLISGFLSDSATVTFLPVVLVPIAVLFGYPEDGYEPSPAWGVALIAFGPSFFAIWLGGWLRRRLFA